MIHKSYLIEQNINLLSNKIVLIYGENIGLIENIRNRIKKNNTNAEIIYLNQDEILKDEELFFNKVLNISLFNESKVFLINQINDKILEIIKNIETKIKTQKIYLFSGLLEKRSKIRSYFEKSTELGILPCYADNEITIRKIISNKLKGYSGLSNQIINNLISNCGLDRSKLDNEINKIVSLFNDKKIDETKLGALLNISENDKFDLLKDQALLGIKDKTNKLISETQLESEKNVFYLAS